jgi:hypothetical protein
MCVHKGLPQRRAGDQMWSGYDKAIRFAFQLPNYHDFFHATVHLSTIYRYNNQPIGMLILHNRTRDDDYAAFTHTIAKGASITDHHKHRLKVHACLQCQCASHTATCHSTRTRHPPPVTAMPLKQHPPPHKVSPICHSNAPYTAPPRLTALPPTQQPHLSPMPAPPNRCTQERFNTPIPPTVPHICTTNAECKRGNAIYGNGLPGTPALLIDL